MTAPTIFEAPTRQTAVATVEVALADPVVVNGLLGIAQSDAAVGESFAYETQGTFLCAVPADTVAGSFLYVSAWEPVVLTLTPSGDAVARAMTDRDAAGRAQVLLLEAVPAGVARTYAIPFAFDTPGLSRGVVVYRPRAGEMLVNVRVQVDEAWDGTDPRGDIGTGLYGIDGIGAFSDVGDGAVGMGGLDGLDNWLYNSLDNDLATASAYEQSYTPGGRLDGSPLKFWVTTAGRLSGGDPGATQGSGVVYVTVVQPAVLAPEPSLGVATALRVGVQPGTTQAGEFINGGTGVMVWVVGEDGWPIAEDNTTEITVALDESGPSGTLTGTLTLTVVRGIAAFGDLEIAEDDTGYVLLATADGLTSVLSSPFDITAP